MKRKTLALFTLIFLSSFAHAQWEKSTEKELEARQQQGYAVKSITPIFGQLLMLSLPAGFTPGLEGTKGDFYIQELVPKGESVKKWTQMITITGLKGIASNAEITPAKVANRIAAGFQRSCPDSFSGNGLGETKLGSYEAFAAVISCGVAQPQGEPYSEAALVLVIRGETDYYTVQWAERAQAAKVPLSFDSAKWTDRWKKLMPIQLCSRVPGEEPPYPSCVNRPPDNSSEFNSRK